MNFTDTYLGKLRTKVGHDLVLMPGAQVVVLAPGQRVLIQRRTDTGAWEIPSGAAEPGQSFVDIAVAELAEEAGIMLQAADLVPFASLSKPVVTTLLYPSGDQVQAFALCFLAHVTTETDARSYDGEASAHQWVPLNDLPEPLDPLAREVLRMLVEFLDSGAFQQG